MAYTNSWDEATPNGASTPSRNIDDEIRKLKLDMRERLADLLGIPSFSADPLVSNRLVVTNGTQTTEIEPTVIGNVTGSDLAIETGSAAKWYFRHAGYLDPATDDTADIGSAPRRVKDLYLSGQLKNAGNVTINATSAAKVILATTNVSRWAVSSSGHYLPEIDNTYDLGSTVFRSRAAYSVVNESGTFRSPTGSDALLEARGAFSIKFKTNSTDRWSVASDGHLLPAADATYDLGSNSSRLKNIYAGSNLFALTVGSFGAGDFALRTNSTSRWVIQSGGHLVAQLDNTYDIGASAGNRPRDLFIGRHLEVDGQAYNKWFDAGNSGAAKTIDWNNGNIQLLTLTADATLTLSNPKQGAVYTLLLKQGTPGDMDVTWPASVFWGSNGAPTLSNTTGNIDIISMLYDGAHYLSVIGGYGY